jgi:hypothetical protein
MKTETENDERADHITTACPVFAEKHTYKAT